VGYALGFIYGGLISAAFSWRAAYFLESLAVLPFIIFFFLAPNVDLRGTHEAAAEFEAEEQERHHTHGTFQARLEEASRDVARMVESPVYVSVVGGMTFYAAVIGAYAFYGPQAGKDAYSVDPETADLAFGGITVLSGVIGTLAGGILLDVTGSTLRNGCLLCAAGLTLGGALVIAAFALSQTFTQFCVVFGLGEAAMFSTAAPSNAVAMWSVPSGLRPLGMSLSVVAMHVLGDVPSPPIMGLVQGRLQNWKLTMSLAAVFLFVGAAVYCVGAHAAKRAIDYRAVGAQPGSSGRMHAEYTAAPGEEEGDGHMPPEVESLSP